MIGHPRENNRYVWFALYLTLGLLVALVAVGQATPAEDSLAAALAERKQLCTMNGVWAEIAGCAVLACRLPRRCASPNSAKASSFRCFRA